MSVGSAVGGAEETVDLVAIIAILAVAGYLIYKFPDFWQTVKDDFSTVGNAVYTPSYPGGGQVAGTSETYSGALSETVHDPLGVAGSILSGNDQSDTSAKCFQCDAGLALAGTCRQDQIGQEVCTADLSLSYP